VSLKAPADGSQDVLLDFAAKCRLQSTRLSNGLPIITMNIITSKSKEMIIDFAISSKSIVTDITTAETFPLSEFPPSSCSGSHYQMTFVGAAM